MKHNLLKSGIALFFLLCLSISIGAGEIKAFNLEGSSSISKVEAKFQRYENKQQKYLLTTTELISSKIKVSKSIKGIYVNSFSLSNKKKVKSLLKLIRKTTLNAVVIDIKNIQGNVIFDRKNGIGYSKFRELIARFQQQGVYVIGRLAVFKDYKLARQSQYALKYFLADDSTTVIDSSKWTNPALKKVWVYNVKIAQQAVDLGIDEIQFDYVRYPTLSSESKLVIKSPAGTTKTEMIVGFLKYARKRIEQTEALISADVFGLTTSIRGDLGIGQNINKMVKYIDYLSPMIYPSHYNEGIYGISNPSRQPYQIIANSLSDAKIKLGKGSYKLRPWLQDFSLQYKYAKQEISAQIKAVQDKQLAGWLLWNPGSNYTEEALLNSKNEGGEG